MENLPYNHRRLRAESTGDQAWAKARDKIDLYLTLRDKLINGDTLTPEDIVALRQAMSLILGELFLRQAQALNPGD